MKGEKEGLEESYTRERRAAGKTTVLLSSHVRGRAAFGVNGRLRVGKAGRKDKLTQKRRASSGREQLDGGLSRKKKQSTHQRKWHA